MGTERRSDLNAILSEVRAGSPDARDRLVRAIYGALRRMAGGLMRHERPGHTLQPSALVHEALLRLLSGETLADVPTRRSATAVASPPIPPPMTRALPPTSPSLVETDAEARAIRSAGIGTC
jgi:hypothetical protein